MIDAPSPPTANREALEYEVLCRLDASDVPNGSRSLRTELLRRGYSLSEPTVGRLLHELDGRGYTARIGFRGRTLTDAGRERLRRLRLVREESESSAALLQSIRPSTLGELLELLVARRAIEREIARLAALNATEADLDRIRAALEAQERALAGGSLAIPEDIRFHHAVAAACGNRVLWNALVLMRRDESLAYLTVRLRRLRRSRIAAEHYPIVDAIAARDPEAAERAMLGHVDHLAEDMMHFCRTRPEGLGVEMARLMDEHQIPEGATT